MAELKRSVVWAGILGGGGGVLMGCIAVRRRLHLRGQSLQHGEGFGCCRLESRGCLRRRRLSRETRFFFSLQVQANVNLTILTVRMLVCVLANMNAVEDFNQSKCHPSVKWQTKKVLEDRICLQDLKIGGGWFCLPEHTTRTKENLVKN